MCELFGMSCQAADRGVYSLKALGEESDWNPHGWGIAYYQDGQGVVERHPEVVGESERFNNLIQEAKSSVMIGHIRWATQGDLCTENCHPFKRRLLEKDWVFAHNGNISDARCHRRSEGQTDSEQIFHEMLDDLEEYMSRSGFRGIYPGLKKAIRRVFERYSRNVTFNFLLSDGTHLFAYNHYPGKPLFVSKREKGYGGAIIVSTCELNLNHSDWRWEELPRDRLLVLSEGRILVMGKV